MGTGRALSGFPTRQLFEVHGSKFKPHPVGYPGQTTVKRVARSFWIWYINAGLGTERRFSGRLRIPGNHPGWWCGKPGAGILDRSRSRSIHHRRKPTRDVRPFGSWDACKQWTAPGHHQTLSCRCAGSCRFCSHKSVNNQSEADKGEKDNIKLS